MKPLRMAMIGGGAGAFVGKLHRAAARLENCATLVAGAFSPDPGRNAQTAAEYGLVGTRVYAGWAELIGGEAALPAETRAQIIAICTPNHLHYEPAKQALSAGFHVVCEKPMTLSAAEAEALESLARLRKRLLGVPFTYACYPMAKCARDLVRAGELGRICKVTVEYCQSSFRKVDFSQPLPRRTAWKLDPSRAGESACMGDVGVHAAHLAEFVTGCEIESVLADLSSFVAPHGLDDDGNVLLRFKGGARGVLTASKIASGEENGLRLRVYGDKRSLVWEQERPDELHVRGPFEPERVWRRGNAYVRDASPAAADAARTPAGHPEGYVQGFASFYRAFCADVRVIESVPFPLRVGPFPPAECKLDYPTAHDGVRSIRFLDAVLASSRAGGVWQNV